LGDGHLEYDAVPDRPSEWEIIERNKVRAALRVAVTGGWGTFMVGGMEGNMPSTCPLKSITCA